ncbi:MAG TPA: VanZ family protein [Bacteroidia bacterium]|nr:VanZ family protein [Bacteroidia bacterium]HNU34015.1 VanZ family protein [Bacteroidia bacterium]
MFNKTLLPGFIWAVFIYALCALPGKSLPAWEWADLLSVDKLVHCFIFFTLTILFIKGTELNKTTNKKHLTIIAIACIAYGAFLELLQEYFFTDRTGSLPDFIANSVGTLLAVFFYHRIKNYKWLTMVFKFVK